MPWEAHETKKVQEPKYESYCHQKCGLFPINMKDSAKHEHQK